MCLVSSKVMVGQEPAGSDAVPARIVRLVVRVRADTVGGGFAGQHDSMYSLDIDGADIPCEGALLRATGSAVPVELPGGVRAWDDSSYTPSIVGWPQSSPPSASYQTFDPLWSLQTGSVLTDPAAGAWFPQQALQLARDANPALPPWP